MNINEKFEIKQSIEISRWRHQYGTHNRNNFFGNVDVFTLRPLSLNPFHAWTRLIGEALRVQILFTISFEVKCMYNTHCMENVKPWVVRVHSAQMLTIHSS